MTIPLPSAFERAPVTWTLGHADTTGPLKAARGFVRFEASAIAVAYSDRTVLPSPVETPFVGGVMDPVDLIVNDPDVWNWKVTVKAGGVAWDPFHINVPSEGTDLASASITPGKGPVKVLKGDRGAQGASLDSLEQIADDTLRAVIHDPLTGVDDVRFFDLPRGPEGPYGGTEVTDPQVASYVTDLQTSTGVAVDDAVRASGRARTGYHALLGGFVADAYGADPTGQYDSTAAVQAAIDEAAAFLVSGVSPGLPAARVFLPGAYRIEGTLTPRSRVTLVGVSPQASRLIGTGSQLMVTPTGGTASAPKTVTGFRAENISFECANGPAWDIAGAFYDGLSRPLFNNCEFWTLSRTSPTWRHRGTAQMIWADFNNCTFDARASSATNRASAPLIDVSVDGGNIWNSNTFRNCVVQARYAAAPAISVVCTNGGRLWHNVFDHVTGQHCAAGVMHLAGLAEFVIESCPEWDTSLADLPAYDGHIFNLVAAPGQTNYCWGEIRRSHRIVLPTSSPLGTGIYDIRALSGTAAYGTRKGIKIIDCDPTYAVAASLMINGPVEVEGRTAPFKVVTGNYSIGENDPELVVVNSASDVTVNLPASTTAVFGRRFTIKNVGAGNVFIPQGADGVDRTLARWGKVTVTTDGLPSAIGGIWFTI